MESLQFFDKETTILRLKDILQNDEFLNEIFDHFKDCVQVLAIVSDWSKRGVHRVSKGVLYSPEHLKNDLNMLLVDIKVHALLSECQVQLLAFFILWSCSNVEVVEVHKRRCNRVPYVHCLSSVEDVKCMLFYRSQHRAFIVEMRVLLEQDTLDYHGKFGRFSWYDNDPVPLHLKPINPESGHVNRMFTWTTKPTDVCQILDRLTIHAASLIPRAEMAVDGYAGIIIQELYNCKNVCYVKQREYCVSPLLFHMNRSKNVSILVNGFVSLGIEEHEAIFQYFNVDEWDFNKQQLYEIYHFTKWISKEIKNQLRRKEKETLRSTRKINF